MPPVIAGAAPALGAAPIVGKTSALGKEDFLKLLITQLKNQDPLNPVQGAEFSAQLAQFSALEQMTEINSGITNLAKSFGGNAQASQVAFAAGLVGREVVVAGNTTTVDANGMARATVELLGPAGSVTVQLMNAAGQVVDTQAFGATSGGRQTLTWRPDPALPAGPYSWKVTAVGRDGVAVAAKQLVVGSVDGLELVGGKVMLRVGGALVPADELLEIRAAAAAAP
ncbi:MAG: flagellar biosynthesis protein FlgD [Gemmatimonadales bacterium]|nr:flagellar biosynthesis protein FlgD [Gemmatimonadales bacterium]